MSKTWDEVTHAEKDGRHELVLSGEAIAKKVAEEGLDEHIFNLTVLNFLEISKVGLSSISGSIGKLQNLLNLVLHSNELVAVPSEIGSLSKLKFLDLSKNKIQQLPDTIGDLKDLQSFNISCNQLESFIDVSRLNSLHVLDLSHNKLQSLPEGIDNVNLASLQTLKAHDNKLDTLSDDLNKLMALKTLDVTNNTLTRLPPSLCLCAKLKELKYAGNKLQDKRLAKMAEQCATKSILDYLFNVMEKEGKGKTGGKGEPAAKSNKKAAKKAAASQQIEVEEEEEKNTIQILHFDAGSGSLVVTSTANVELVRPYIVCCIVRNINLNKTTNMYKRFINLQNKLHDEVCGKRVVATIATHDLDKIKPHLTYDAREPESIQIQPLMKLKVVSAAILVARLRHEAEELRKEKKRNTVSGIHKYLELLQGQTLYPCFLDGNNVVISFPPITNSNATRISRTTSHILIEVTSSQSREVCKKIMDQMLHQMLEMDMGETEAEATERKAKEAKEKSVSEISSAMGMVKIEEDEDHLKESSVEDEEDASVDRNKKKFLTVQQVKIVDHLGSLKIVYPSKIDLKSDKYVVVKDF